ncbi:MAG: DUF1566 domain-containing protein [Deltaproteobacteria bacterium]|nr:DUF1566 domain-containing protein [Deltaproteobacteria bacterium]
MRRFLLISLSLVLALVGWSSVGAEDGFYVIPAMRGNYAPVPKTGQTNAYGRTGTDGDLKKGVAWPTPRFTDNNNGTVTDKLTGLIWMKNAQAFGAINWVAALTAANGLAEPAKGLTDGSVAGDWRLPNVRELQSLIDYGYSGPALPNTLGTGKWEEGSPFQGVQSGNYWSSSTTASNVSFAWSVNFLEGYVNYNGQSSNYYVWCVRGGP